MLLLPLLLGVALCVLEVSQRSRFMLLKDILLRMHHVETSGMHHTDIGGTCLWLLDRERRWEGADKVDNLCQKQSGAVLLRDCQRWERRF